MGDDQAGSKVAKLRHHDPGQSPREVLEAALEFADEMSDLVVVGKLRGRVQDGDRVNWFGYTEPIDLDVLLGLHELGKLDAIGTFRGGEDGES